MKTHSLRSVSLRLIENVATILVVLIFFSLFAVLVTRLFVPGTSLQQMVQKSGASQSERTDETSRDATLEVDGSKSCLADAFRFFADSLIGKQAQFHHYHLSIRCRLKRFSCIVASNTEIQNPFLFLFIYHASSTGKCLGVHVLGETIYKTVTVNVLYRRGWA